MINLKQLETVTEEISSLDLQRIRLYEKGHAYRVSLKDLSQFANEGIHFEHPLLRDSIKVRVRCEVFIKRKKLYVCTTHNGFVCLLNKFITKMENSNLLDNWNVYLNDKNKKTTTG